MGLKDLFNLLGGGGKREAEGKGSKESLRIEKYTHSLINKNKQTEDRLRVADLLAGMDSKESLFALCRRFDMTLEKGTMDQNEKEHVIRLLLDKGEKAVGPISDFLKFSDNITLPAMVLEKLVPPEKFTEILLNVLGEVEGDFESNPDKKVQILKILASRPEMVPLRSVISFLKDFDEPVRFATLELIAAIGDRSSRDELLNLLVDEEEESQRIKYRVLEIFAGNSWNVKGFRKKVEDLLPEEFFLNREGIVRKRERGGGGS